MADETETITETTETEVPETTEPVVEEKKHPLAEGGVRFEEVVREKNEYRAEAQRLREENARLQQARQEVPRPETKTPPFYTADQLQQAVDSGRISAAQMADQLAWQRAEQARQQWSTESALNQKKASASAEVNQYVDKIPALGNPSSPEFLKAARAASDIADEMGLDVRDPRVQRRALQVTFGTLDRITDATRTRDYARERADTFTETRSGAPPRAAKPDPFKDIPQALKDQWDRMGYTHEQRVEEAKYFDRDRWKRRHG